MTTVRLYRVKQPKQGAPNRHVWQLRYMDSRGKRRGETVGECKQISKRDAERRRRDRQSEFDSGSDVPDKLDKITLPQLWQLFKDDRSFDLAPTTLEQYRIAVNAAAAIVGVDTAVSAIDDTKANRIKVRLSTPENGERQRSKATINKLLAKLSALFAWAVESGKLRSNPFAKVKRPKVQSKQARIFTKDEMLAIVTACPSDWWRAFVLFAISTGCRRDEILHMTWQDVNLFAGSALVTAKRQGTFTADGCEYPIMAFETKAHIERSVQLSNEAIEALRTLYAQSDGSVYVFVDLPRLAELGRKLDAGKLPIDYEMRNNTLRDFKRFQQQAFGDDRAVGTVHDIRKTFGTWMADHVPPHRLQKAMGHANLTTTMKYYVQVDDAHADTIRAAVSLGVDSTPETDKALTKSPESAEAA